MEPTTISSGKRDSSTATTKRKSTSKTKHLNSKPLQSASKNHFQNVTSIIAEKEQTMEDRSTEDLNTSLIAHNSDQTKAENKVQPSVPSNEEVIIHYMSEVGTSGDLYDNKAEETPSATDTIAFPSIPPARKRSQKRNLSLSEEYFQPNLSAESAEIIPTDELMELNEQILKLVFYEIHIKKARAPNDIKSVLERTSSVEEMQTSAEEVSSLHEIINLPSFPDDDLPSYNSCDEDERLDPSAKVTEDSLPDFDPDTHSIEFTTLFRRENAFSNVDSPNDDASDAEPSTSQEVPKSTKKARKKKN